MYRTHLLGARVFVYYYSCLSLHRLVDDDLPELDRNVRNDSAEVYGNPNPLIRLITGFPIYSSYIRIESLSNAGIRQLYI